MLAIVMFALLPVAFWVVKRRSGNKSAREPSVTDSFVTNLVAKPPFFLGYPENDGAYVA
ncbi:MAG: hypothetical protein AAGK00_01375 [Pseudomonadota bacterium]